MFLRFLRLLIILFASITILSCGILLPVDTAGLSSDNFSDKLSRLSWGKYVPFLAAPTTVRSLCTPQKHPVGRHGTLRRTPRRGLALDLLDMLPYPARAPALCQDTPRIPHLAIPFVACASTHGPRHEYTAGDVQ